MLLREDIPEPFLAPAEAAVRWINEQEGRSYELTGLADAPATPHPGSPIEMGLVLCDGELCSREQIRITGSDGKWEFDAGQVAAQEIPPLLDPPAGVRRTWLEAQLGKFEFVLLLFYRGRW